MARACHAETFYVPNSTMAHWVGTAARSVIIDGCFLKCHGRVLKSLIGEEKLVHIDALPLHRRYKDVFSMDDVPEGERKAVARQVADAIINRLWEEMPAALRIPAPACLGFAREQKAAPTEPSLSVWMASRSWVLNSRLRTTTASEVVIAPAACAAALCRMRGFDRDPVRGRHYGQRPCQRRIERPDTWLPPTEAANMLKIR